MLKKIFFIAEIGINHNGSLKLTYELIEEAKKAGFDAVKFQKRDITKVYSKELLDQPRSSPWGKTQRDQKLGLELTEQDYDKINIFCKKLDIVWFASAWDLNSLKFLDKYNLQYNKVASAMIVDKKFLKEVAKRKKYTFISTGMSLKIHINDAVNIFKKEKCDFELMHCISTYPMKIEEANLLTILALKKEYKCQVGYSGHESGLATSYCAAILGASSIERHITLDRSMYGSDQAASLESAGMRELISVIKRMQIALGENKLGKILESEKEVMKKLRAHIKV
jgi:N-acetylneuraminate synthase